MDTEPARICRTCGAPLPADAGWCSLCHRRSFHDDQGELAEELSHTFEERSHYRFQPRPELVEPSPPPVFSRWLGGPLSFSPGIKLLVSLIVGSILLAPVLIGVALLILRRLWVSPFASPFFMVMSVVSSALGIALLLTVWRRTRIR